jgi:hypothetical protein
VEYDFLTWTSFPSSVKLVNDEPEKATWLLVFDFLSVKPGASIRAEMKAKQEKVLYPKYVSGFAVDGWDGKEWKRIARLALPLGNFDWSEQRLDLVVPSGIMAIRGALAGGAGSSEGVPGFTWFDDLKIYQDDVLIYANDFSNWNPYIGAGLGGALTAVPAYLIAKKPEYALVGVIGALIGAGVGYMTAKP